MDEGLRRRLTGAAVLLTAALLFTALLPAPVNGPIGSAGRAVTYEMRDSEPAPVASAGEEPTATEESQEEAPPESAGVPVVPVPPPEVAPQKPPSEKLKLADKLSKADKTEKPVEKPAKASPSTTAKSEEQEPPGWYVQIGSFGDEANAKAVLQQLYNAGQPTHLLAVKVGSVYWFRVRVGPYATESAARASHRKLVDKGYRDARVMQTGEPAPAKK